MALLAVKYPSKRSNRWSLGDQAGHFARQLLRSGPIPRPFSHSDDHSSANPPDDPQAPCHDVMVET